MAVSTTAHSDCGTGAAGGGIYLSGGSATLEGGTIVQNNEAIGVSLLGVDGQSLGSRLLYGEGGVP